MNWLTSNLFLCVIPGVVLLTLSFVQFVKPNWKLFGLGAILLVVGFLCMALVAIRPPGGEKTIEEVVLPNRLTPIGTHLQRLKSAWDSEKNADWPVAETLAEMSEIAYLPPVDAESRYRLLGFTAMMPVVASSMIGYVVSADEVTVIAFRGTDSGEVSDWIANLELNVAETPYGSVHKGFYEAYQSLQPQLMTILRKTKPRHLWITGHSLGGALALVCAFDLIDSQNQQIDGLITFGQPMVARKKLAEHLDLVLLSKFVHFVNNADIVPRIPPNYAHCGSLVWFNGTTIQRSRSKRIHAAPAGGTPQDGNHLENGEIPPVSETEFRELQSAMKRKPTVGSELPDGQEPVAASLPLIDDHSMKLYLKKIRNLLGMPGGT